MGKTNKPTFFIKDRNSKKGRKATQLHKKPKAIVVEDIDLLHKDHIKKIIKNPTCGGVKISGKKRRKMLKRLKHSQAEKSKMEVEVDLPKRKTIADKDTEMKEAKNTDSEPKDVDMG
ncbi:hypothetical protein CHS0354_026702 [Potamilus streckersoni]|uniref:Uncharacterized protein n=1 Tax=Potamilus streckersoni TaxID=2493646 RepID=A0AAE0S7U3_9BIVA|nr:hypothetical protein CHS0354_026702 [Potamilus streckersoni]